MNAITGGAVEYLQEFLAAAPDTIAALRQSLDRADFDEISRQVHNLTGSSLFLGIDALTGMARLLELAAQRKDPRGVAANLAQLEAQIALIVASLQTSTPSPSNDNLPGPR